MSIIKAIVFTSNQSQRFRGKLKIGFQFTWRTATLNIHIILCVSSLRAYFAFHRKGNSSFRNENNFLIHEIHRRACTQTHTFTHTDIGHISLLHILFREEEKDKKMKTIRNANPIWKTDILRGIFYHVTAFFFAGYHLTRSHLVFFFRLVRKYIIGVLPTPIKFKHFQIMYGSCGFRSASVLDKKKSVITFLLKWNGIRNGVLKVQQTRWF